MMSTIDFPSQAIKLAEHLEQNSATGWLNDFRQQGLADFKQQSLPTRKTEHWKYTSLFALTQNDFGFPPQETTESQLDTVKIPSIENLDSYRLVLVNGSPSPALSSVSLLNNDIDGLSLVAFAEASSAQQEVIAAKLGKLVDGSKHWFAALNNGLTQNGWFLQVDKNVRLEKPVEILHISTTSANHFSSHYRLLVDLQEGSEACVVEHFSSDEAQQNVLVNALTEAYVGANAKLEHYRLHLEEEHLVHIGGVHVELQSHATLNSFNLGFGGLIKRIDFNVAHVGQGAHCDLNGIYLPQNEQHIDFHTNIEHKVAHCTTDEVFRGIVMDKAKAVFNGKIHIFPDAQKTRAELSNKNLLTSNQAEINTKPELEIYADDVRCAHGATVAQMDKKSLFYLVSRGISKKDAQIMLNFGFINELLNELNQESIANYVRPMLADKFGKQLI